VRHAWLLLVLSTTASAQVLSVRGPEPEIVPLGGRAVITLLIDAPSDAVSLGPLPRIDGLEIAAGRPTETSFQTISGGRVTSRPRTSFQIRIKPLRLGSFELPPFMVEVDGQTHKTKPQQIESVPDSAGDAYAFLEINADRESYFVQEPVTLHLRLGFDREFFEVNATQLFRQRLDVPVQLLASWLRDLPGTIAVERAVATKGGKSFSFALNDGKVEGIRIENRQRDGRSFTVLEIEETYLPLDSGELVIPESMLRFAYATRFRDDFLRGRVPLDRREAFVSSRRLVLDIRPLPDERRPADFSGAVGSFSVAARARPRSLRAGDTLKLTLSITGRGNLDLLEPPRLGALPGFHVYGAIKGRDQAGHIVTYDLMPLTEDVKEVPTLHFSYFDPGPPPGYRTVTLPPIPLEVQALPPGRTLELPPDVMPKRPVPGLDDIFGLKPTAAALDAESPGSLPSLLLLTVLVLPWPLAFGLLRFLEARERDRRYPELARARRAARVFHARLGREGCDLTREFAEFLAARLECRPAAVIAPGLVERLRDAGLSRDLAERSTRMLEGLVAKDYGGGKPPGDLAVIRDLVDACDTMFREARQTR
jgi:hypothetical protein